MPAKTYDGQGWRIAATAYGPTTVTRYVYFYSAAWQVVEEQAEIGEGGYSSQYVWGLRYIDDLVLRYRVN